MKILTAHQSLYYGWLGLYEKISRADTFCFFDDTQFDPNDFQNRNYIKTPNGKLLLTVPTLHKGYQVNNLKIKDIRIDSSKNWQKKHFKSIQLNYKKALYFDKYYEILKYIYIDREWEYLAELNEYILKWILKELEINTKFVKASDYNFQGKKSDLIIDMCKKLNVNKYIFGMQGKNYADIEKFKKEDIEIEFQDYKHPKYKQVYLEFESNMCILDLLMNVGEKSLEVLIGGQE